MANSSTSLLPINCRVVLPSYRLITSQSRSGASLGETPSEVVPFKH